MFTVSTPLDPPLHQSNHIHVLKEFLYDLFSYYVHLSLGLVSCLFPENPFTNTWETARNVNLTHVCCYSTVHVLYTTAVYAGAVRAQNRCFLCSSTLACAARGTSAHGTQTQSSNTFRVCTWPYQHSFVMTQLGTNISVTDM